MENLYYFVPCFVGKHYEFGVVWQSRSLGLVYAAWAQSIPDGIGTIRSNYLKMSDLLEMTLEAFSDEHFGFNI